MAVTVGQHLGLLPHPACIKGFLQYLLILGRHTRENHIPPVNDMDVNLLARLDQMVVEGSNIQFGLPILGVLKILVVSRHE